MVESYDTPIVDAPDLVLQRTFSISNVPKSFLCPLTLDIMKDPVSLSDGHSYEREAIAMWLVKSNFSPMTNTALLNKILTPNHTLRSSIDEYMSKIPLIFKELDSQKSYAEKLKQQLEAEHIEDFPSLGQSEKEEMYRKILKQNFELHQLMSQQEQSKQTEIGNLKKTVQELREQNARLMQDLLKGGMKSMTLEPSRLEWSNVLIRRDQIKVIHVSNMDEACPNKSILAVAAQKLGIHLSLVEIKGIRDQIAKVQLRGCSAILVSCYNKCDQDDLGNLLQDALEQGITVVVTGWANEAAYSYAKGRFKAALFPGVGDQNFSSSIKIHEDDHVIFRGGCKQVYASKGKWRIPTTVRDGNVKVLATWPDGNPLVALGLDTKGVLVHLTHFSGSFEMASKSENIANNYLVVSALALARQSS